MPTMDKKRAREVLALQYAGELPHATDVYEALRVLANDDVPASTPTPQEIPNAHG